MTQTAHDTVAAFGGIDWADANHEGCLPTAGGATREGLQLEHPPEAIDAWGTTLRTRCNGQPVAICLALTPGPLGSAGRTAAFLGLFPRNPLPLARYRAACTPRRAQDDPPDAVLQRARLLTPRDTLPPLPPQRPTMRALAQLVAHRRRVGGATVRMTHRLTRTLKHSFPHGLPWFQEKAPAIFCDGLRRWPPLKAVPRARRSTLATCCRAHH